MDVENSIKEDEEKEESVEAEENSEWESTSESKDNGPSFPMNLVHRSEPEKVESSGGLDEEEEEELEDEVPSDPALPSQSPSTTSTELPATTQTTTPEPSKYYNQV